MAVGVVFETANHAEDIFNPELSLERWNLILRKADYEFLAQIHIGQEVRLETVVTHIGTTSLTCRHRAYQGDALVAEGISVMVHFDYQSQTKAPIPAEIRARLEEHLVSS